MDKFVEITVRGYHCDTFSHVNNARYLEFLEEARWAIYDDTLQMVKEKNWSFAIVNININYRAATFLHDVLQVDAKTTRIGNKSFTMGQQMIRKQDGLCVADAQVTCVVIDNASGKSVEFDDEMRELLGACE